MYYVLEFDQNLIINRPQLRSAPVFVGIAGVMAGEENETGDATRKISRILESH